MRSSPAAEIISLKLNIDYPSKGENEEERAGYKSIKTVIEKYSHFIKSGSEKVKSMKKSAFNPPLLSIFSCNDIYQLQEELMMIQNTIMSI